MKSIWILLIALGMTGTAFSALPPPTPEQAAKAEEAKAKTAWGSKVAAYQLCLAQDRVAARYLKGKANAKSPYAGPACENPGAFVVPQVTASK